MADLYGRKQLFLAGLTLGLVANIVSGVIPVSTDSLYSRHDSPHIFR
jgi:hypothetical protein